MGGKLPQAMNDQLSPQNVLLGITSPIFPLSDSNVTAWCRSQLTPNEQ